MGIGGIGLIALIASGDTGTTLGFESNTFGSALVMALWGVLIGAAVLNRGVRLGDTLKQSAIWALIILGLMAGYVFRYDLQDIASRFTGGIVPGSPITAQSATGTEVTLIRSDNGHFEAVAGVNNASIRFLVDTGASAIVLSDADAREAGIDTSSLAYSITTYTANGTAQSAVARIESLYLGGIERRNLRVLVSQPGRLGQSLLGQQFLESLSSYEKRGDRLTLRD